MHQALAQGEARIGAVTLVLRPSNIGGTPADLGLTASATEQLELPEDLLAMLGRAWRRLRKRPHGWRSLLRLRAAQAGARCRF